MLLRSVLVLSIIHSLCHALGYSAAPATTLLVYNEHFRWATGVLTASALAVGSAVCSSVVRDGARKLLDFTVEYASFGFFFALIAHARHIWMWLALPLALHLGFVARTLVRARKPEVLGSTPGKGAQTDTGFLNQAPRSDAAPPLPPRHTHGLGTRAGTGLGTVPQPPPRASHRTSTNTTSTQLSDRPGSSSRRAAEI